MKIIDALAGHVIPLTTINEFRVAPRGVVPHDNWHPATPWLDLLLQEVGTDAMKAWEKSEDLNLDVFALIDDGGPQGLAWFPVIFGEC